MSSSLDHLFGYIRSYLLEHVSTLKIDMKRNKPPKLCLILTCFNFDGFRLKSDKKHSVISCKDYNGEVYRHAFTGSRLVSWLIETDEIKTRQDGVNLGRRLLENDIIRHGE